jgi:hypothetical protein
MPPEVTMPFSWGVPVRNWLNGYLARVLQNKTNFKGFYTVKLRPMMQG